jgi:hypothetical protein
MFKYLILTMFLVPIVVKAQEPINFQYVDSVTYQCYLNGDWDQLIRVGELAIGQKIDFKRLRQRIGYAYFVKSDFYAAQFHYEKALKFDESDVDTRSYLYYCGINTGDAAYARFHAEKLPKDLQLKLKEDVFKPVDAVDFEISYKANSIISRSNPTYLRAGINSQLGYRLSLYQSVSSYQQTLDASLTKQQEYYAFLNWSVTSHTSLGVAYHYLNTGVSGILYPSNLVWASLTTKMNRFSIGINGSILSEGTNNSMQFGLKAGVTLPGKSGIYFNSSLIEMNERTNNRIIFSQSAGARLTKTVWAEGNVTLGNLLNYNDHNALYVYNSADPSTFRTGLTLSWYLGRKVILFGNYMYDKKQIENTNNKYNQYSFSGGFIWKL